MDNIVSAKLDSRYASTLGVWQYDYGQVLRITGPELPPAVEVQFSLDEKSGETLSRVGTTVDGVTEVKIPDELLTHSATSNYRIYAYIYLTDETSGNTKYEIIIPVRVRSKPTSPAEDPETDPDLFRETVVAVNASAERAKMAEQNAKASATEAGKYAASASESAVTAEKTKEDALRKVGEKKQEAIEAIQNQEETSVGKITTRTDGEIQRIQNQATDSKAGLEQTITNADASKKDLVTSGEKAVQDIQAAGSEQLGKMQAVAEAFTDDREQIATNKKDIGSLKEDIGNKAPAIIKKASGKTIIINDSSNLPIKILSGTGKIIITGKNILNIKKKNEFIPFEAKAGTLFTLITNGELSEGGNILFTGENDEKVWFAIDKGKTRVSAKIGGNVKGYKNLLSTKEGLKYCFSVGENDEYEEYVEQVITTPVDSEQLKAIHTNYPTTVLTSENEISVEYVADTEAYIGKRIKEENQSLQKQILEIQSALISQKISGV